ncbi:hypothetical protein FKP32DRAFT_1349177 [Trametes sanguinea]|nr:hypothetical protein FKP32DRAFT_1349177 [Trametes sanguinea]
MRWSTSSIGIPVVLLQWWRPRCRLRRDCIARAQADFIHHLRALPGLFGSFCAKLSYVVEENFGLRGIKEN